MGVSYMIMLCTCAELVSDDVYWEPQDMKEE